MIETLNPDTGIQNGVSIAQSAEKLRNVSAALRAFIRMLSGRFLSSPRYEDKYRLAYDLYTACEHNTRLRERLQEMRGGKVDASVRQDLKAYLEGLLHAPDDEAFLCGFYHVAVPALIEACRGDLQAYDPSGNANELRITRRLLADLEPLPAWAAQRGLDSRNPWVLAQQARLQSIGGLHGDEDSRSVNTDPSTWESLERRFTRPKTIIFDERIEKGELMRYEDRLQSKPEQATVEQFKVFFNEFYAAALLATVIFDATEEGYPWEFFADFTRHFWDEARHSEFGAIRLKELGVEPDRCNPVLFELSEDLPILHRVLYLTRGLEAYFMPRKSKRFKEYEENGDLRSQLFADQDWSDEMSHIKYGARWSEYLLEEDNRDWKEILEEVKAHLSKKTGKPVTDISAPF